MELEDTTSDLDDGLTEEQRAIEEELANEQHEKLEAERMRMLDDLAGVIQAKFFDRARRRKNKEIQWLESGQLYLGNLSMKTFASYDKPFSDTTQSGRPYYNIIRSKCDIAIAQSVSMQFAGGEQNWSLGAEVSNKDPQEVEKARAMQNKIASQLEHCSYGKKSRRAIEDRVILGVGILKGPVNTGKMHVTYEAVEGEENVWVPTISTDKYPGVEYVNPWFFYPDDTVNDFSKSSDTLEAHPKSAFDLKCLASHPGFIRESIEEVLRTKPADYMESTYSDYASLTASNPYLFDDKYLVLEYHGPITNSQLEALSIEPAYEAIDEEYYGEVWVCQGKVIRIELENIEASFELPYGVSVWMRDPGSVFGFGAPQLMKDAQRVARETWHMILDNASISSGPQIAMHKNFIEPADKNWQVEPRKIWYLTDASVDVSKAIQFFNVPNVIDTLMPVLNAARSFAEEESSTPQIAGDMQSPGMAESATGALLIKQSSTTILDFLAEEWDDNITEKLIRRFWAWNMQYGDDPSIKGNYRIDVRTSTEYKNKQQFIRDIERLSMETKQDPELAAIVDRAELMRARLAMMHLPSQAIIRTPEQVKAIKDQQAQQPNPDMMDYKLKEMELQIKAGELELKKKELEFNAKQQQLREQWEHEEKMSANYARTVESEAMVIRTQNEKETQMLQLAAKMEEGEKKNAILKDIATMNNETKLFTASLQENRKQREALLTQEELFMKREFGTGI